MDLTADTNSLAYQLSGFICTGAVFAMIFLLLYAFTHRTKHKPPAPQEPEED